MAVVYVHVHYAAFLLLLLAGEVHNNVNFVIFCLFFFLFVKTPELVREHHRKSTMLSLEESLPL